MIVSHHAPPRRRLVWIGAWVLAAGVALAGCGASASATSGGHQQGLIGKRFNLKGASFTVGSLDFTEERIMGWLMVDSLRAAGAQVTTKLDIAGVNTVRKAELSGDIGMYPSYTGTGWIVYLHHSSTITNPAKLFKAVAAQDRAQNGIVWIGPAPYNDTYDIATSASFAKKMNLHDISDLVRLARTKPQLATFCSTSSFQARPDGLPGLEKAYGFTFPSSDLRVESRGLIYASLAKGSPCHFGETYSTDARLIADHLTVLKDNKNFFPLYNGAITVRASVFSKHHSLRPLFDQILKRLTNPVITRLNAEVDVKGMSTQTVAQNWLRSQGLT